MNNSRFEDNNLRPTYMSQLEANELMELWAERQREEAARQSLITVHDVAEATQLSVQDVERLLQEIRSKRPSTRLADVGQKPRQAASPVNEPTLWEAYLRLAPLTGLIAFLWAIVFMHPLPYGNMFESWFHGGRGLLFFYAFVIAVIFLPKFFRQYSESKQSGRSQEFAR